MFIVGLTGGIATGKTTVSQILQEHGIPIVDADSHARKVVEPGKPAWKKICKEFGSEVLKSDGTIDRQKLGAIIFQDRAKRKKLNEFTHPEIYKSMFWETIQLIKFGHQFVVLDLPLLFESGVMVNYLHKIIVVTCEKEQQLQRLLSRDGTNDSLGKMKIEAQMPLDEKAKKANFVIDNSGTLEETRAQVEQMINILQADKFHWKLRLYGMLAFSTVACIFGYIILGAK